MRAATQQGQRIKRVTGELVRAVGGIEVAAADLVRGKSTVHRWTDRHDTEHFLNVDDCATLEAQAPRPLVTELLCRMAGGVFVTLPQGEDGGGDAIAGALLGVMDEVGQLASGVRISLSDGHCDPGEAATLRGLLGELMARAAAFDLLLAEREGA